MSSIPKKGTVYVVDDDEAVRDSLQWLLEGKDYRVRCYAEPDATSLYCDALLLAVKPQQMRDACAPLKKYLKEQLVISIAAGLRLADLSRWLGGYNKLVRTMPNTPALIGQGMTAVAPNATVTADELPPMLSMPPKEE